ncbi:hypothetical protein PENTCL1PPCAC_8628, partial [Pristionchus entomophagus]
NHSLFDWLNGNSDPASRDLFRMKKWFKQMVSAVNYIHSKNLTDICYSPVTFFSPRKILSSLLGIATERRYDVESNPEIVGTSTGTTLYMSPEQRLWFRYSTRSDVFSLSLIFAELCIVMTASDRSQIFDAFRRGDQHDLSNQIKDEKTVDFIKLLTQVEPRNRPSSREMIDHILLA